MHAGYSFPEIDAMYLEDYDLLAEYWSEHPPLQMMVQAYLGFKPKSEHEPKGIPLLP
jgi:hypothetical protein